MNLGEILDKQRRSSYIAVIVCLLTGGVFRLYRQELLAWLNNLLQLNITKIEQCGTGYGFFFLHSHTLVVMEPQRVSGVAVE